MLLPNAHDLDVVTIVYHGAEFSGPVKTLKAAQRFLFTRPNTTATKQFLKHTVGKVHRLLFMLQNLSEREVGELVEDIFLLGVAKEMGWIYIPSLHFRLKRRSENDLKTGFA